MNTRKIPRELALDLLERSDCRVQVAAVITDKRGVNFSIGWNHAAQDSKGKHAEVHAIERANKKRLAGATITIAARRKKNGNIICARPCEKLKDGNRTAHASPCMELLKKHSITKAQFTTNNGWEAINI